MIALEQDIRKAAQVSHKLYDTISNGLKNNKQISNIVNKVLVG